MKCLTRTTNYSAKASFSDIFNIFLINDCYKLLEQASAIAIFDVEVLYRIEILLLIYNKTQLLLFSWKSDSKETIILQTVKFTLSFLSIVSHLRIQI